MKNDPLKPEFVPLIGQGNHGFDSSIAAKLVSDMHALVSAPITMKELQGNALKGMRRTMNLVRSWGQGTPAKHKNQEGRKRIRLADGRHMHPTKGIGKSERGGYAKRSRRSNTSRS